MRLFGAAAALAMLVLATHPVRSAGLESNRVRLGILLELQPSDVQALERQAAAGDGEAMGLLGEAHGLAFAGLPQSDSRAAEWLRRAARAGQSWAAPEAEFFAFRSRNEKTVEAAAMSLERARRALEGEAGGEPDPMLESLARLGLLEARELLAAQYASGRGRPRDEMAAARWYSAAAGLGSGPAHAALAEMYAEGTGVPHDPAAALLHRRAAAEKGVVSAQLALAAAFVHGAPGVAPDMLEGMKWMALASLAGSETGRTAFAALVPIAGRDLSVQALALARDWQAANPRRTPEAR